MKPGAMAFVPERTVTRNMLEHRAASTPGETLVVFEDGKHWTCQAALHNAYAAANGLRSRGIGAGHRVGILFANGPDFLRAWWGAAALGAELVPIHTGYRGQILAHLLRLSRPDAIVGDPSLMGVLDDVGEPALVPPVRLTGDDLRGDDASAPPLAGPIETWHTQFYMLTSGTTGPSKLARCTYRNIVLGGWAMLADLRRGEDRALIDLPMYHAAALRIVAACLSRGIGIAVRSAPKLSTYWEVAKETGATMSALVGSMVDFVLAQPPRPAERDHRLRVMIASPLPADVEGFKRRFGLATLQAGYGSTEVPGSLRAHPDDSVVPGYCGRLQPGYEARIVDAHDIEVPQGQPGELVVRYAEPWVVVAEYVDNPAATASAWRNGWFHTGDMLRCDAQGRFFFVDRVKDALRRRGENISSAEVEAEVLTFAGVKEAACVACRLPGASEDEVKVWIVSEGSRPVDFEALLRHCARRLPHFMVPRFFELTDALPRTFNQKLRKLDLRERGNGAATWDREAHGLRVTRSGVMLDATPPA